MSVPSQETFGAKGIQRSALVFGATGATGRHLLRELLTSKDFTRVGEYGRRVTPREQLPALENASQLEQKVIDFENLASAGLKDGKWDVIYIAISGTGSSNSATWEKVDREYVLNAAREAKSNDPTLKQRILYISSTGANTKSYFRYTRSKGLTENGLASIGYSDTIIFRPAFLDNAQRGKVGFAEKVIGPVMNFAGCLSNSATIDVRLLAKTMVKAGALGSENLPSVAEASKEGSETHPFTVIRNKGALLFGRSLRKD